MNFAILFGLLLSSVMVTAQQMTLEHSPKLGVSDLSAQNGMTNTCLTFNSLEMLRARGKFKQM